MFTVGNISLELELELNTKVRKKKSPNKRIKKQKSTKSNETEMINGKNVNYLAVYLIPMKTFNVTKALP